MHIASLSLNSPLFLAPLAGYTDLAFRLLCREHGAGMCFSEMISSQGLVRLQQKTMQMVQTVPEERPVAFQLFGSDPDIMGEAAAILSAKPIDMIDINMGCPVKKVIKTGAGAALMKEPALAEKIIRQVCKNSTIPVSVKIRSGWDRATINATDFANMAEDAGVSAVTIHGRTWTQGFSGQVDWRIITRVKQAVSIPVIGNGDIHTFNDALAMMSVTGCDGAMIGRAALGNPWVFHPKGTPSSIRGRLTAVKRHLELISEYSPADRILAKIKNHLGRYLKGIPGGSAFRKRIYDAGSFLELRELINLSMEFQSR